MASLVTMVSGEGAQSRILLDPPTPTGSQVRYRAIEATRLFAAALPNQGTASNSSFTNCAGSPPAADSACSKKEDVGGVQPHQAAQRGLHRAAARAVKAKRLTANAHECYRPRTQEHSDRPVNVMRACPSFTTARM